MLPTLCLFGCEGVSSSAAGANRLAGSIVQCAPSTLHLFVSATRCAPQVGNKDALNCYYAHAEEKDSLQVG